ncbi:hypothetical protein B7H23_15745 [Notoacmeibacter marinus]|uniref:Cell wall hydrolase SleB domain-containing protein n=2 Tax=Notoacmeibacter marinus TaxID=1876515 RepID=A0A231UUJ3_9HYPH|nr:hypothetical protein B7H23_15745 [Notoacmeibacter marinus]
MRFGECAVSNGTIGHRFHPLSLSLMGLMSGVIFFAMGDEIAIQDTRAIMASMTQHRWSAALEKRQPDTVMRASYAFAGKDGLTTGSIASKDGVARIELPAKKATMAVTPDEDRINRADKRGRLVRVAPRSLPDRFKAGSLYGERSMMLRPAIGGADVALRKPMPAKEAMQLAEAFRFSPATESNGAETATTMLASATQKGVGMEPVAAMAFAPSAAKASPFDAVLGKSGRGFVPELGKKDHKWAARRLPNSSYDKTQQRCLAIGIYFEARGEPQEGQAAVAQVILNRVRNPTFPDTICGVVYQNKNWRNRCQFSFACDGKRDKVRSSKSWSTAKDVARKVTYGEIWLPRVGSSTHYHATYVKPRWARHMDRLQKIGRHIFYRTKNGGWG